MLLSLPLTTKIMSAKESKTAPYVAYCPELDIASAGKDPEDAQRMLDEAVKIVLKDAAKQGQLKEYLANVGYTPSGKKLIPPKVIFSTHSLLVPQTLERELSCLV